MTAPSKIWNVIYDAAVLDTGDQDLARREADEYMALVERGVKYDAAARRENRRETVLTVLWRTLVTILVIGVLAAAALGGLAIYQMEANDHAGYDRKQAPSHAADALKRWFGENEPTTNMRITSLTKDAYLGRSAWRAEYHGQGKELCVYVWDGDESSDEENHSYAVVEGANC